MPRLMHYPIAMRILLLTETLHAGGAETFVLRLARALRRAGEDCEVLNLNPNVENPRLLEAFGEVPIHRLRLPGRRLLEWADRLLVKLGLDVSLEARLMRRRFERDFAGRYDIFHSNLFKVDLLLAKAKRRFPHMRCVSTLHGDYALFHGTARGEPGERIANWRGKLALLRGAIDAWVHIADQQAELLVRDYAFPAGRFHKIYSGYEPPGPLPAANRPVLAKGLTFVMAARGIPEKGWESLIRAFLRLDEGSRLLLVGESAYLDALRCAYPAESIAFVGFHPNPPALIQDADVFVFPTHFASESLPTVVAEALFCGVPVIATAVGEIPAMLQSGDGEICGRLLDPGPDEAVVDRLAAAMTLYLADASLLDRHRALAASAFAKFDMGRCTERYRALYRSLPDRLNAPPQAG